MFEMKGKDGNPLEVLVVGGSLCGLMHGIMYKRLGHNVHILEQASTARAGYAAGITARDDVLQFMKTYDVTNEKWFIDAPEAHFLNKEGKTKRVFKRPLCMTSWNILYHRLRANFDGLESAFVSNVPGPLEGDGDVVYDIGQRVIHVEYIDDKVRVEYQNVETLEARTLLADLVIAADGSNSFIRRKILPEVQRLYSGYVAFRGIVPQREVSKETLETFIGKTTIFSGSNPKTYILLYNIPGDTRGDLEPGSQLLNYVWYWNVPRLELDNIMTDINGHIHRNMLPVGKIRPEVWNTQLTHAQNLLPAAFVELIEKTKQPFISVVNDHVSPQASFFDGKLLLVGDALSQFRPHIAMSTNQAALHALTLEKVMKGETSIERWEGDALRYAKATSLLSTVLGVFGQYSFGRFLVSGMRYLICIAQQMISRLWRRK